jgi:hypothetical protein
MGCGGVTCRLQGREGLQEEYAVALLGMDFLGL